ncbi:MAG: tRNA 2-selenouridine(34) synthase MnmH [Burkholderiales bacterium]|nr:MAG: tRNA 2-selenouridine(34) synthase MnmH [Burkholderiales bacterium]
MKEPQRVDIDTFLAAPERFDAILDVRSPSEFAEDHVPGASSCPVLDDAQRAEIGTLHARESAFAAARRGAALVSRNIAQLLETRLADRPRHWRPLVYCWRGGQRSGALATVLARVGWPTSVLDGGYRAYRRRIPGELERLAQAQAFVVLAGRTGSAKSRLLEALEADGAQVLDLERLAAHRGSVLGDLPGDPQPSQKMFESRLWDRLRRADPSRVMFVESESKRVGRLHVPDALMRRIRAAPCARIEAGVSERAAFLLAEYSHFTVDRVALFRQLDCLVPLHGRERIAEWKALAERGHWQRFVERLLADHYDPAYDRAIRRNFGAIDAAPAFGLDVTDARAREATARALRARHDVTVRTAAGARKGEASASVR